MRDTPAIIALLAVVIFIPAGGCSRANFRQTLDQNPHPPDIAPKVLADYQPWFGGPDHINVGYSTQDPGTLRKQIQQAKGMGIYAFAVDWYGPRQPFLDHSYALLQQMASQNHFHVCLMYDETEEDNGHATEDSLEAMVEAYNNYLGPNAPTHDAYVFYRDRPVIFIFPKRGHTDWNRVRQVVDGWEKPPILIYKDEPPQQYAADFDGEYAWVHPGPKGWSADGSEWGKQYLETFYQKMERQHPDKIAVGGVWPGFDDSKASWGLNRHMDRRCGKTFDDTLHLFQQYDDGNFSMPFLLIATWNDYEEGTQIENGVSQCRSQSRAATGQGQ
jgi:Glycosyl hydrolase family 99